MEPAADPTFARLRRLQGTWRGRGTGGFPTVEDFEFEEHTTFALRDAGEPTLHYEQRVWVLAGDGSREPSHWETGFVRLDDDGHIQVLNAQNSGRVEVLAGTLQADGDEGWTLTLASVLHGADPRMVAARRELRLRADELGYEVWMTTTGVPESALHLSCTLRRASSPA